MDRTCHILVTSGLLVTRNLCVYRVLYSPRLDGASSSACRKRSPLAKALLRAAIPIPNRTQYQNASEHFSTCLTPNLKQTPFRHPARRHQAPAVGLLKLQMRSRFKRGWYLRGQGQLCQTSWERKGRGNAVCGCHVSKNMYATKASVGNPEESIGNFV